MTNKFDGMREPTAEELAQLEREVPRPATDAEVARMGLSWAKLEKTLRPVVKDLKKRHF